MKYRKKPVVIENIPVNCTSWKGEKDELLD